MVGTNTSICFPCRSPTSRSIQSGADLKPGHSLRMDLSDICCIACGCAWLHLDVSTSLISPQLGAADPYYFLLTAACLASNSHAKSKRLITHPSHPSHPSHLVSQPIVHSLMLSHAYERPIRARLEITRNNVWGIRAAPNRSRMAGPRYHGVCHHAHRPSTRPEDR
jgi:hypothetical protein